MGLVRRATADDVAADNGASIDMAAVLRQSVAAEIERQRQDKLEREADQKADG